MYRLLRVIYWNGKEGEVDDVTLNELIRSKRVKQFYRPSEDRWIEVGVDAVRSRETRYKGPERRVPYRKEEQQKETKPRGLVRRLLWRKKKHAPPKKLTAGEWFQQGFLIFHGSDDYAGAVRALAQAIQLNPTFQRAFVNRGMVYERIGNAQQAIDDYSRAIQLAPDDAKVYYARGILLRHLGREREAIVDLRKAADLGYRPAINALKSRGIDS